MTTGTAEDAVGAARHLRATVEAMADRLRLVSAAVAARRPGPGQWSTKEIVGHLIDSATTNHQRFVRARWQDDLVFPGYAQDTWVNAQGYQEAPWNELVELWRGLNLHIAHVMESTPVETRLREHERHNLDEIAWQPLPAGRPATLDYFMRDYVAHLEHHLGQIEALIAAP